MLSLYFRKETCCSKPVPHSVQLVIASLHMTTY